MPVVETLAGVPEEERWLHGGARARQRLLKTALELFAERGFDATSVRDLASAARVNLGAVNYYFGSKENLRIEAFRYGLEPMLQLRRDTQAYLDEARSRGSIAAAEEALRKYIRRFLEEILSADSAGWSLLMREFTAPSAAFGMVMRAYFEPQDAVLLGILQLLMPKAAAPTLTFCLGSIMGQCLHVRNSAPVARSPVKADITSQQYLELRAAHIFDFSVLAIRGLSQRQARQAKGGAKKLSRKLNQR
jgi:AcrR family transcriptional regulator